MAFDGVSMEPEQKIERDPVQPKGPVQYLDWRDDANPSPVWVEHNQKPLLHEGEVGNDLYDLTDPVEPAPESQHERWTRELEMNDRHLGQRQPWVAIDLDGTILEEIEGGRDVGEIELQPPLGPPKAGSKEALVELARLGWRISIYSARFGDERVENDVIARWAKEIATHLEQNEVPFSDIWVGRKPRADYFVDNKAIQFRGDWQDVLTQLTAGGAR